MASELYSDDIYRSFQQLIFDKTYLGFRTRTGFFPFTLVSFWNKHKQKYSLNILELYVYFTLYDW